MSSTLIELRDIVASVSITVNVILVFVAKKIQTKVENKRFLKSFLIEEIKALKKEYEDLLNSFCGKGIKPKQVQILLKLKNIKVLDVMDLLKKKKYRIPISLEHYHRELREILIETPEVVENYKADTYFALSSNSMNAIVKFRQEKESVFNKLILFVNDK